MAGAGDQEATLPARDPAAHAYLRVTEQGHQVGGEAVGAGPRS
ncbi:hypothetical protein [Nonomuraea deserti]|nr:hypothetical protein [Nonomuraea deserti]